MTQEAIAPPTEIARANQHDVKLIWPDGHASVYPARWLRQRCPCAACVDELTGHVRIISSSIPEDVRPLQIAVVGRYGMNVRWSDGHTTGIFPFDWLRRACLCCRAEEPAAPPGARACGGGGGACGCRDAQ